MGADQHRLPVAQNLDLVNATALQALDLCIPLHNNPAYTNLH